MQDDTIIFIIFKKKELVMTTCKNTVKITSHDFPSFNEELQFEWHLKQIKKRCIFEWLFFFIVSDYFLMYLLKSKTDLTLDLIGNIISVNQKRRWCFFNLTFVKDYI